MQNLPGGHGGAGLPRFRTMGSGGLGLLQAPRLPAKRGAVARRLEARHAGQGLSAAQKVSAELASSGGPKLKA